MCFLVGASSPDQRALAVTAFVTPPLSTGALPVYHRAAMLIPILTTLLAAQPASPLPLPGGLEPGPHRVGFRVVSLADPSRPTGPKVDASGQPVRDRSRPLAIHVWYPAAGSTGAPLTVGDYVAASDAPGAAPGSFAADHRQSFPRTVGLTLDDATWDRYTKVAFTAARDAPPAAGTFPLLIGMLRPVSVVVMAEYLASHGYVAAFVQRQPRERIDAEGLALEALIINEHMRDMQLALARMRQEPFVDPVRLGAVGFSGDGLAQLVLAMRHPDVDAVSQLETGYFAPVGTSSYQEVTAYDTAALRAPMLFAYSENLGRNTDMQMAEIERMRYAPRFFLYLGEPRMNHWDFATEGIVLADTLDRRRDAKAGVVRAFRATQRYQLAFFDAFVKRTPGAAERLKPSAVEAGPGPLIEARERPAVVPAIARAEFRALLDRDAPRAMQLAREGLGRDPHAAVFDEAWLNALGYEMLQRSQPQKAVEVFTLNVEAHPGSANAFDSISEALESMGQRDQAVAWAVKGLSVLPADRSVPTDQRKALEEGLRARIARLKAK
jgi:dienelactone hydrolase